MPPSTTSLFPDINVWVALTYEGHTHHSTAAAWFATVPSDATLAFCRFTQLGLLRLLTAKAVMSDEVMTQSQAWAAYDRWHQDPLSRSDASSPACHHRLGRFLPGRIRHGRATDTGHVR